MRVLLVFLLLLSVTACTKVTNLIEGEDNVEQPAPLTVADSRLPITKAWQVRSGYGSKGAYLELAPFVTNKLVVVGDAKGQVSAFTKVGGNRVWQVNVGSSVSTGVAVKDDLVVVGTADAQVIALRKKDGHLLWKASVPHEILARPTIAKRKIIVKTVNSQVIALKASDGKEIWRHEHRASDLTLRTSSAARVIGNRVIVGFSDGKLAMLDLSDGHLLWQRQIALPQGSAPVERLTGIVGDPLIINGIIYVATYQGNVAAVVADSGRLLWQHEISAYSDLTASGSHLFISDAYGDVWAFKRDSGDVVWHQKKLHARGLTAPIVMQNTVVVGDTQGYLHWLDKANGEILAHIRVAGSPVIAAPVVKGNHLYVLTQSGVLARYYLGLS